MLSLFLRGRVNAVQENIDPPPKKKFVNIYILNALFFQYLENMFLLPQVQFLLHFQFLSFSLKIKETYSLEYSKSNCRSFKTIYIWFIG